MDQSKEARLEILETVLNKLPFEIWYKNVLGEYVYVNEAFAEGVGLSVDECIGKRDFEIFNDEMAVKYRQADWDFLFGEGKSAKQFNQDGKQPTMEFRASVEDENKNFEGIVGCDIEGKLAEIQSLLLQNNKSIFRSVFENSPFGMAIYKAHEPVPDEVNQKYCDILGVSEFTALNTDWRFMTHPDDIKPNEAPLEDFRAGLRNQFSLEKRFIRPSGDPIWTRLTVLRLPSEPEAPDLNLAIIEDIDQQKRLEQAMAGITGE